MKKLIIAMLAISAIVGVMMFLNQPPPPPVNYTAMAQPARSD